MFNLASIFYGFVRPSVILFFLISWFHMVFVINLSNIWNSIIIQSSLGLLTFIAIFYSFILRKDFVEKRESLLAKKWNENISKFENLIKSIKSLAKKEPKEYKELLNKSENLNNLLNSIASLKDEININNSLLYSTIFFIVSILLFLLDSVNGFQYSFQGNVYSTRFFGFTAFWYASYHVVELIRKWFIIVKDE